MFLYYSVRDFLYVLLMYLFKFWKDAYTVISEPTLIIMCRLRNESLFFWRFYRYKIRAIGETSLSCHTPRDAIHNELVTTVEMWVVRITTWALTLRRCLYCWKGKWIGMNSSQPGDCHNNVDIVTCSQCILLLLTS